MNNHLTDVNPNKWIIDSHDDCSCLTPNAFNLNIQNDNVNLSVIMPVVFLETLKIFTYFGIHFHINSWLFEVSETWICYTPIVPFRFNR